MNAPLSERLLEAFTEYTETKPPPHAGTLATKYSIDYRMLVGILVFHGHMSEREAMGFGKPKLAVGAPRAPLPADIRNELKELQAKLGTEDAAKLLAVPAKTMRRWLMGDSGPRAQRLARLRAALGLPAGRPQK